MTQKTSRLAVLAACLALGAISQSAHAQSKPAAGSPGYVELGFLSATYKEPSLKVSPMALRVVGGMDMHPNLGVEGLLGFNVKAGDGKTSGGTAAEVKLTTVFGVYAKPKMDVSPELELFGRLGFANVNRGSKLGTSSSSDSGSSLSYGLGASYRITRNASIGLDYMSYYNRNDITITGFTASVGYRF